MSGISDLDPASFGLGLGARGTPVSGTHVQIQDDNSGAGSTPVLSFSSVTPRTHPWAMMRTGHINAWGSNDLGAGAGGNSNNSDVTHPQVTTITTGTTTTGHVGATSGGGVLFNIFSATSHRRFVDVTFKIPILSTAAQQFRVRFGWANVSFGAVSNGVYFEIDSFLSGTARCITSDTGVKTDTDSGVTIVADTWYRGIIISTNNTAADFYLVNEGSNPTTPVATNTTNIPNGTGKGTSVSLLIEKIAGTTSRELAALYIMCGMDRYAA